MANRRFIDFPIASTVNDNDIVLIWQDGLNKQTTKGTLIQGAPTSLEGLTDGEIAGLINGQILQYNSTTGKWENVDRTDINLSQLGDVSIVSPSDGQVLVYNSSTSKWENSSGGYVPYVGAVTTVDLGAQGLIGGYIRFNTSVVSVPNEQGLMYWEESKSTVALIMNGTTQHIGQDTYFYVKNSTGSSIAKGVAVRFDGTDGASGHLKIAPFLADGTYPSAYFMGVTAEAIDNGDFGQVTNFGEIEGIDTSIYSAGDLLYASTTSAGAFQTTAPVAPNNIVLIAAAVNSKNNGAIIVRPTYGSNINDDEGVKIVSPTTGDLLQLQAGGLWENKTKAQVLGGTSSQFVKGDGSLDSTSYQPLLTNPVTGTGTTNYLPKFTGTTTIGNSQVFDNGTNVGIGTASPNEKLTVNGKGYFNPYLAVVIGGSSAPYYGPNIIMAGDIGSTQGAIRMQSSYDGSGHVALVFQRATNSQSYNQDPQLLTFTDTMRIAGTGNLLVNTSTDSGYKLDVNGTGRFTASANTYGGGSLILSSHTGGYNSYITSVAGYLAFSNGGSADHLLISSTGAATFNLGSGEMRLNRNGTSEYLKLNTYYLLTDGNDQLLGSITGATSIYAGNGVSPRLTITSGGNVGIGTSSPSEILHLRDSANGYTGLRLEGSGGYSGSDWTIYSSSNSQNSAEDFLGFYNNSTTDSASSGYKMRIFKNGKVGIGTSVIPTATSIHDALILGKSGATSSAIVFTDGGSTKWGFIYGNSSKIAYSSFGDVTFESGASATERMRITSGGNVLVGTTTDSGFKLDVNGTGRFSLASTGRGAVLNVGNVGSGVFGGLAIADGGTYPMKIWGSELQFLTGSSIFGSATTRLTISNTGAATFSSSRINLNSPSGFAELYVKGSGSTTGMYLFDQNTESGLWKVDSGYMAFGTNNTERMRITSSGNVGIGTTTDAGYKLDVNGTGRFGSRLTVLATSAGNGVDIVGRSADGFGFLSFKNNANNTVNGEIGISDAQNMLFYTGASVKLTIASTGAATFSSSVTATSFITSSDTRLKEVIERDGDLAVYKRKGEEQIHYGYLAQEMQEIYPNQVHENQDGFLSLNYVEILVKKVNELEKKIKQLEK